ncbi:MAG TPA: CHASE2 domain-containing protein, partial [Burkholderiaceae bacterium]
MRGKQRLAYLLIALLAAAISVGLWALRARIGMLDRIDRLTLDAQLQWRGPLTPQAPITLALIDDASLRGFSATDRRALAQAIQKASEAGARLIVLDMLLIEPGDAAADQQLAAAIAKSRRVLLSFAMPEEGVPAPV